MRLPVLLLLATAARAQAPIARLPERAVAAMPHVQSPIEALEQDAAEYARVYEVPVADAMRRLRAQAESVPATDALAAEFAHRLAGITVEHRPDYRIVVLLTGDAPVPDRTVEAGGMTVPIAFRTGAPASRARILAAIGAHQADLRAALDVPPGMGVDPRSGALVLMIGREGDAELAARLAAIAGVPVELRAWAHATGDLAVEGGGRVTGVDPADGRRHACTSGFAVTDGVRTGIATAAHCPDALAYRGPDGRDVPLTMVGAWGAFYQDVQIHVAEGPPLTPTFYADTAATVLRPVTSWRNRTSMRAGDFVCHRGERTGTSCAEIAFVDYAPPGDLCAGPCEPTWVAVAGPHCRGGDSGGPVYDGTVALGLVKGGSYGADGTCRLYYYMSTDYLPPGWLLLHE